MNAGEAGSGQVLSVGCHENPLLARSVALPTMLRVRIRQAIRQRGCASHAIP